ncbi:MAG: hypothetical protein AB1601_04385 [Planctomycetota bacterium]
MNVEMKQEKGKTEKGRRPADATAMWHGAPDPAGPLFSFFLFPFEFAGE